MKRFINEVKFMHGDAVLTVEHCIVYKTIDEAAESFIEDTKRESRIYVGFRIIELQEVESE